MKKIFLPFFAFAFFLASCSLENANAQNLKIANWNVQCFFDATKDGTEYSEFKKSKNWNRTIYETRLDKLCDSIRKINADIFVLEEIENHAVVVDISNRLQDMSFSQRKKYNYAVFAKNPGDAIGIAVLSKLPILESTVHNIDIRNLEEKQPSMRPILKVKVKTKNDALTIFANHWKSKSGGAEKTEIWRNFQESRLQSLIGQSLMQNEKIIACGDFNRDISEFFCEGGKVFLRKQDFSNRNNVHGKNVCGTKTDFEKSEICLVSPWFLQSDTEIGTKNVELVNPGSYYYNDEFERIDHFFVSENLNIAEFAPLSGEWCSDEGIPYKFQIYSGKGYSDHLPIQLIIEN